MEMEPGKLFIGGISWDTNEERLRDYFQAFGEVVEAVIMKDRTTGRARGFGFIVFADPTIAERVVKQKHIIDGRNVEAKKAVPRDDQQIFNRSNGSNQSSPGPTRTKKIFVGGLASTVTESDFKNYFDQFGTITDVVVMYDHNTQRPRGFGFITYDSDESVDKVLLKTFHELNGKMVEVKRAVPKELSPGPNRGYSYANLGRVNSYVNAYTQGYGIRDGRFSPVNVGRTSYSPFGYSGYSIGSNSDPVFATSYSGNGNFCSNPGYRRAPGPVYSVTPNRFVSSIGYGAGAGGGSGDGGGGNASVLNSRNRDMWGSGNQNYTNNSPNSNNFFGYGGFGTIWANSNSGGSGGGGSGGGSGYFGGNEENGIGYGRNSGNGGAPAALYGGGDGVSFYADATWRSSSPDLDVPGLFSYGFGSGTSDGMQKNSVGYVGYSIANRSNRGIAT